MLEGPQVVVGRPVRVRRQVQATGLLVDPDPNRGLLPVTGIDEEVLRALLDQLDAPRSGDQPRLAIDGAADLIDVERSNVAAVARPDALNGDVARLRDDVVGE
jgi:hypothetical protein